MEDVLHAAFVETFASSPHKIYSAPGRVNIIGEHTDYNDGFVLPVALDVKTAIAASKRPDRRIDVLALDEMNAQGEPSRCSFDIDAPMAKDSAAPWADYLKGLVQELKNRGHAIGGVNLVIKGNVPRGAGLSSSASLENAFTLLMSDLFQLGLDGASAAKIGQAAENNFVGCQCGIMDQMVSAVGEQHHALLLDCRSLSYTLIPLPDTLALVIINSNVKRGLVDSEYNLRREQCEAAAAYLNESSLRDVEFSTLQSASEQMDPLIFKRAKHVITENARTLQSAEALRQGDYRELSQLMHDSHESMKNDFEITVEEIDTLVDIVRDEIGNNGGVRMTGGGFGGCVVALVPRSMVDSVVACVDKHYCDRTGYKADIFLCTSGDGAFV